MAIDVYNGILMKRDDEDDERAPGRKTERRITMNDDAVYKCVFAIFLYHLATLEKSS